MLRSGLFLLQMLSRLQWALHSHVGMLHMMYVTPSQPVRVKPPHLPTALPHFWGSH